jgi:lipopolysaccharide export LptBFGC system permease protein LptF
MNKLWTALVDNIPTPDKLCWILGSVMMVCLAVFFLADTRIPYERRARKLAAYLAIGILLLFVYTIVQSFIMEFTYGN